MLKKVFVIERNYDIIGMFNRQDGYISCADPKDSDIIVWPGGADVNPKLYGQEIVPAAHVFVNDFNDQRDVAYWNEFHDKGKLLVGICRGGQFLNVMNNGTMWQDVNNHGRSHRMTDLLTSTEYLVTSTHHQMMRSGIRGEVLAIAHESNHWMDDAQNLSCKKPDERPNGVPPFDTEVVWYKDSKSLCFQPHPEYGRGAEGAKKYFFKLVDELVQK